MVFRPLLLFAAFAVLLVSGLVHGVWTQRWQPSQALEQACLRLQSVPATAGAWQGADVEVDPEAFRQARAVGYWMRRYTKEGGGNPITVILMCGQAGHMSVHTPDICYRGAGYEMVDDQIKEAFAGPNGGKSAEFWTARFRQPSGAVGNELRIYWTWSDGGNWQAPSSPRWTFGSEPFLYKLYIVRDGAGSDGTTAEFLRQFLPVLEKSLIAADSRRP